MVSKPNADNDTKSETIQCWVAGDNHIYREALRRVNASEVILTHVYMSVDLREKMKMHISQFHVRRSMTFKI